MTNARILVVDDDPKFLRYVSELLIGAAYDVHCSEEPLRVLEMAENLQPTLVILDIGMPGKDGLQVAQELRASPKLKGMHLMFLTAHPAAEKFKEAKEVGGVAYLEKPFRSSSLLWMVKTLLDKGQVV